ncbi:hypothetical protein V6N13_073302 [Hibiscus sabdariffa]|uniref:Uncharacterized protein n=1 Tax=Hibiscus sabdariffa TaxID=183260 RepID=A0ABR2E8R3_9ROSI
MNAATGSNDVSCLNATGGPNDGSGLNEEEEMVAIKKKSRLVEELRPDVVPKEIVHISIKENEDLRGLGSREETSYLDSTDVGSYEIDSDGDIICKNSGKAFFYASTVEL